MPRRSPLTLGIALAAFLAPAPQTHADPEPASAVERCALLEESPPPFATTPPATLPIDDVPSAALAPRVELWTQVWAEAGDGVVFLVDARRPEIVHAVVDCGTTDDASAKGFRDRCDAEVALTSRAVRAELRDAAARRRHPVRARFRGARALLDDAASHVRAVRGRRDALGRAVARATPYLADLEHIFVAHGVPARYARLAIVESLFRPHARSKAGAVGAFQFLAATAREHMTVTDDVDERLDVLRAGDAAARYLAALHARFGRWDLALTAYNTGPARVARMIKATGTRDLGRLVNDAAEARFGFDGRNYAAQVEAVVAASDELLSHTGRPTAQYARLVAPVTVDALARCVDVPTQTLVDENPALTARVTDARRPIPAGYVVAVPASSGPRVARVDDDRAAPAL